MTRKNLSSIFLLILLSSVVSAQVTSDIEDDFDQVLVNSQNWADIYQGLLYAHLLDKPGAFIFSPQTARATVNLLPDDSSRVLLLQPSRQQQYAGLSQLLDNAGFSTVDVSGSESVGTRLADTLTLKTVIVTDSRYPYNAIALSPYATYREGFVLFSDITDTNDIIAIIEKNQADVVIYGIVDTQVLDALSPYSPEIIDEGGKFDNNAYLAEYLLDETGATQVTLTNGEFVESGLVKDPFPIVFLGRTRIPDQVETLFLENNITYGVVVGNYLAGLAQTFKDRLEANGKDVGMVIRFGQVPITGDDSFVNPQPLEFFALPIILPEITISGITYNRLTQQLEVTYTNPGILTTFFVSSIVVTVDGEVITVGDASSQILVGGQSKTILYDLGVDANALLAEAIVTYGDYPTSLELQLIEIFEHIPIISVLDESQLEIQEIIYDRTDKAFYITLYNPGEVDVYTNLEMPDVIVDGLPVTLGTKTTAHLEPAETKEVYIRATLSNLDIVENEEILVRGFYGQRKNILFKTTEETLTLSVRLIKTSYVVGGVAVLALIIIILLLLFGREKDYQCNSCGHVARKRRKPSKHHCGGKYKKR